MLRGRRRRRPDAQAAAAPSGATWTPTHEQPPQEPHDAPEERGTARDGDGAERRYTVVSWRPGRARKPPETEQAERTPTRDRVAAGALVVAGAIIAGVIVGGAVVVYGAQYDFALAHNGGNRTAAAIQAAVPEAVWVAMSALGLAQALRGRSSLRATLSIALFFSLSLAAQLLHAEQTREGYLVAAITPIALALMLEALLHGVRHWALARDGQDTATVPLLVRLVRGLLLVLVMPWAWLLRLILDFKNTKAGMREWLLDVIPYAPGRTRAQDRAREAQLEAGGAQELAEQVRTESAAEIAELKQRHARELAEREQAENERTAQLRKAHEQQLASLQEELGGLRSASGDLDGQLQAMRRELSQERTARQESEQRHAQESAERQRQQADAQRAAAQAAHLATELEAARANLSARQQVELLYAELHRTGDGRYGSYAHLDQVAEEIYGRLAGAVESRTVRRYLREYLSAAEPVTATGHEPATPEARVNTATGSMIGGA